MLLQQKFIKLLLCIWVTKGDTLASLIAKTLFYRVAMTRKFVLKLENFKTYSTM